MRRFLALPVLLAVASSALACGGVDDVDAADDSTDNADASAEASSVTAPEGDSREIAHPMGTTVVTGSPTRVATVNGNENFHLLSYGLAPVASPDWIFSYGDVPTELAALLEGAEPVAAGETSAVNLEQLAAARPDLILAQDGTVDEIYDELSGIAPTVVPEFAAPWQDTLALVGKALGQEELAEQRQAEVEAAVDELAEEWGERTDGLTYTLMAPFPADGQYYVYSLRGVDEVFEELGMARPTSQVDLIGDSVGRGSDTPPLSREQFDVLDADAMFVFGYGDESDVAAREEFAADPLLQRLDVARQGAVYNVNSYTWYIPSAYGIEQVVADLDERILPDLVERAGR